MSVILNFALISGAVAGGRSQSDSLTRPRHDDRRACSMTFVDNNRNWWLFDATSHSVSPIHSPDGLRIEGATASHDGKLVVVAAFSKSDQTWALFRLEGSLGTASQITKSRGHYSDPVLDPSLKYIYATYVPGDGSPLNHANRQYAEISRVELSTGKETKITSAPGCHFSPTAGPGHSIAYVHAACFNPSRWVDFQTGSEQKAKRLVDDSSVKDPALSDDGKLVTYAHLFGGIMRIAVASTATGKVLSDVALRQSDENPHPQFDCGGSSVFVNSNGTLFKLNDGVSEVVAKLAEGSNE